MRKRMAAILAAAMLAMGTFAGCGSVADADTVEIVNVSYDPTRELYQAYNTLFEKHWEIALKNLKKELKDYLPATLLLWLSP